MSYGSTRGHEKGMPYISGDRACIEIGVHLINIPVPFVDTFAADLPLPQPCLPPQDLEKMND